MQQTLQHNGRFGTGAAPKLLMNQGGSGAAPMMAGRMMAGGMTGQSLTSGLEDLKKTAGVVPEHTTATAVAVQEAICNSGSSCHLRLASTHSISLPNEQKSSERAQQYYSCPVLGQ
jgi:hypothetical protein